MPLRRDGAAHRHKFAAMSASFAIVFMFRIVPDLAAGTPTQLAGTIPRLGHVEYRAG
jgi:hypothetical protein